MTVPVVGLGAGGHAKVVIEILRFYPDYQLIGLLDPKSELHGRLVLGVPVLGNDDMLSQLVREEIRHFFIGLGSIGNLTPRRRLYEMALNHTMKPVNAIHPQAIVSPSVKIGAGVTMMAGTIINACVTVGDNVIINTGAIVEHECILEDHVHIATGAKLASTVYVAEAAHVGAGAVVRQSLTIGQRAVIGAGAVVVKDVPDNEVVVGVPARILKSPKINLSQG